MTDPRTKTARPWKNLKLVQWVLKHYDPTPTLDYGCGVYKVGIKLLEGEGWEVDGFDLEQIEGCFSPANPPTKTYPLVILSNVVNVQSTKDELTSTITEAWGFVTGGGFMALSYPASPRKLSLTKVEMRNTLDGILGFEGKLVDGMMVWEKELECPTNT